ncbi:MAG: C40 family peptidase [Rhodocyclaceae bacterium]|jgi:cell wall-associated NlpC family hydrolase
MVPQALNTGWSKTLVTLTIVALAGCSIGPSQPTRPALVVGDREKGHEVVMYAFGLIDIDYRFGGSNPESGLDCSGMVSYLYRQVTGARLPHNAAAIAQLARPIERAALQPGDLVFFNTQGKPFSHIAIFVGEDRFVHAPSTNGKIRINRLSERYYAQRFESARTILSN